MLKSRMIGAHRDSPPWRKSLAIRQVQVTEIEQNEERCFEAMLHWRRMPINLPRCGNH
jgi:hypothetical protein